MTPTDYIWKKRYRDELRRAVQKLTANPTASESVSTPNGGSRSVTFASIQNLLTELRQLDEELAAFRKSVNSPDGVGFTYARWC